MPLKKADAKKLQQTMAAMNSALLRQGHKPVVRDDRPKEAPLYTSRYSKFSRPKSAK